MNEFTPQKYINLYRKKMWHIHDLQSEWSGAIYILASDATEIQYIPLKLIEQRFFKMDHPDHNTMLIIFDFDDYLMTFRVGRFGNMELMEKYIYASDRGGD